MGRSYGRSHGPDRHTHSPLGGGLGPRGGHVSRKFGDVVRFALAGAPFVIIQLGYNAWLFGDP